MDLVKLDRLSVNGISVINKSKIDFLIAKLHNRSSGLFGPTGLLTITFTRNNVVGHALFVISLSHSREFSIMQLCGGNYTQFDLKFHVDDTSIYIVINDAYSYEQPYKEDMEILINFLSISTNFHNNENAVITLDTYINNFNYDIPNTHILKKHITTKPLL